MDRRLAKKARINEIVSISMLILIIDMFFASKIVAPRTTGIASKKENLIASSFFNPQKSPAEIVEPLLEIPGRRAKI